MALARCNVHIALVLRLQAFRISSRPPPPGLLVCATLTPCDTGAARSAKYADRPSLLRRWLRVLCFLTLLSPEQTPPPPPLCQKPPSSSGTPTKPRAHAPCPCRLRATARRSQRRRTADFHQSLAVHVTAVLLNAASWTPKPYVNSLPLRPTPPWPSFRGRTGHRRITSFHTTARPRR